MNVVHTLRKLIRTTISAELRSAAPPVLPGEDGHVQAPTSAPRVEVVDSQTRYGRILGGATSDEYMLRVSLRMINETQEAVVLTSVMVTLDGRPLDRLLMPGPALPVLLTGRGQERLQTDKLYSPPCTIPAKSCQERYTFFRLPMPVDRKCPPLHCTATVLFARHPLRQIPFMASC
jgi:hypothetical protein